VFTKDVKVACDPIFSSMYHLVDGPIKVHWNKHNWTKSFVMLLDEHHK
jgi:hypothetical protein